MTIVVVRYIHTTSGHESYRYDSRLSDGLGLQYLRCVGHVEV